MRYALLALAAIALFSPSIGADDKTKTNEIVLVVMDPMALELSCPCVKGYAQRNYGKLGAHLTKQLGRPVKVHFADSLTAALKIKTAGKADLVIGKDSVIRAAARGNKLDLVPLASLTDKEGKTTQTGLWVVPGKDPALSVSDLKGYDLVFGNADADEKYSAALALLRDFEIKPPEKLATCGSCSDAASKVLEAYKAGKKTAAVISSYAQPLLEGCGTVKKGDLRVIGETDPVPFVTAFINSKLSTDERTAIQKALLAVGKDADLCKVLETKKGFVLPPSEAKKK
jgi:ABC-type phosphate/phosphonate transport system substrate-binding protein